MWPGDELDRGGGERCQQHVGRRVAVVAIVAGAVAQPQRARAEGGRLVQRGAADGGRGWRATDACSAFRTVSRSTRSSPARHGSSANCQPGRSDPRRGMVHEAVHDLAGGGVDGCAARSAAARRGSVPGMSASLLLTIAAAAHPSGAARLRTYGSRRCGATRSSGPPASNSRGAACRASASRRPCRLRRRRRGETVSTRARAGAARAALARSTSMVARRSTAAVGKRRGGGPGPRRRRPGRTPRARRVVRALDVLPLLVATDGAVATAGIDVRRLRPNLVISGVEGMAERDCEDRFIRIGEAGHRPRDAARSLHRHHLRARHARAGRRRADRRPPSLEDWLALNSSTAQAGPDPRRRPGRAARPLRRRRRPGHEPLRRRRLSGSISRRRSVSTSSTKPRTESRWSRESDRRTRSIDWRTCASWSVNDSIANSGTTPVASCSSTRKASSLRFCRPQSS